MPRSLARLAAVVVAATLVLLPAAPAAADPEPQDCALDVDLDVLVCVAVGDDLAAAYLDETGRELLPSPDEGEGSANGLLGPLASYSLVTFYVNTSYAGASFTIVRSTPCNGSTLSSIANLGTVGMNDAISSFATYGSCEARLYEDVSYGGSTFGYTTSTSSLPTFNDLASSARAR